MLMLELLISGLLLAKFEMQTIYFMVILIAINFASSVTLIFILAVTKPII